jgi:hypothetical protein
VSQQYDVIHYAGHGRFDAKTKRAGWVFAPDCFLSATEIFRVRQVPRLVFANACFSAVTTDTAHGAQNQQLVGLAQAFFARGIPNFIGAGWQVDDTCALECARWFYARVLGIRSTDGSQGVIGTSPPATIGDALREAKTRSGRRCLRSVKYMSSRNGFRGDRQAISQPFPGRYPLPELDCRNTSCNLCPNNSTGNVSTRNRLPQLLHLLTGPERIFGTAIIPPTYVPRRARLPSGRVPLAGI